MFDSFEQCSIDSPDLPTVGLFGTCGQSTWREQFINCYVKEGVKFFNPNKRDWNPDDAKEEALHLKMDEIVLFPILGTELGVASLAESSFSILEAVTNRQSKFTVILIEDADPVMEERFGKDAYKSSRNARQIVKSHLTNWSEHSHVFVVETLDQMLDVSLKLNSAAKMMMDAKKLLRAVDKVAV